MYTVFYSKGHETNDEIGESSLTFVIGISCKLSLVWKYFVSYKILATPSNLYCTSGNRL